MTAHTSNRAARCEAWVWDQEDSSLAELPRDVRIVQ